MHRKANVAQYQKKYLYNPIYKESKRKNQAIRSIFTERSATKFSSCFFLKTLNKTKAKEISITVKITPNQQFLVF